MKRSIVLSFTLLLTQGLYGQDRPLPPSEAPKRMTLPDGFQATLFAGEPDVVQPIAMTFDDRGRLWVVECLSYPKWADKPVGSDRVIMFEDTDGDGKFDKRQVIFDKGANLSGIELGFGGIWLCSIPNLLFIPCDFNADLPAIGKPEAVLDGWSLKCSHNVFNSLTWGPDGWLYGLNGIIATSLVGKPGTPENDRVPMNCGVWRYHPTRKIFEPFGHGTTNPFGLDFDDFGEMFITNCVISHIWHVMPGAHFERMYGEDLNKNLYKLMPSCADHIHWGGGPWTSSRGGKGVHSEAGGGHAHVGCMVYLGNNWPEKYRNGAFMLNLHGSRINHDRLERKGSGYVAKHEPDFMLANDPWFRGIAIRYGPDGGVYASDWTDTGECHNYKEVDRTNGRIYKIAYGKPKLWQGDLSKLSDVELARLQMHQNDWFVRHARRLLQERSGSRRIEPDALGLLQVFLRHLEPKSRLRALWALYSVGELRSLAELIDDSKFDVKRDGAGRPAAEMARAWAIRLAVDFGNADAASLLAIAGVAGKDSPPFIKMAIASALRKLPLDKRFPIAKALLSQKSIADDPSLSLMCWYAVEPFPAADAEKTFELISAAQIPLVQQYLTRRFVSLPDHKIEKQIEPILQLIAKNGKARGPLPILKGIYDAVAGLRKLDVPAGWNEFYASTLDASGKPPEVVTRLAVVFGDPKALSDLNKLARDTAAKPDDRRSALQALSVRNSPELATLLQELLLDKEMRGAALRALAGANLPDTPERILKHYSQLSEAEKTDAVQTLASRPAWAMKLLDSVEAKQLPRSDVSVFVARQIQGLKDKKVQERLAKVWGQIKPASKEKVELTAKFKKLLTPEYVKAADLPRGRLVFSKNCASCHRLYDDGGNIGPALTGAQRHNLEYVLENVLDPSAVVAKEYQMVKIETLSGRTINGIIKQETDKALTLQTPNEMIVLPKDEIETRQQSPLSLMPEGIFDKLTNEEIRDLVAYLASKDQVPLPRSDTSR